MKTKSENCKNKPQKNANTKIHSLVAGGKSCTGTTCTVTVPDTFLVRISLLLQTKIQRGTIGQEENTKP